MSSLLDSRADFRPHTAEVYSDYHIKYVHAEVKMLAVKQQKHLNLSHGYLFEPLQKVLQAVRCLESRAVFLSHPRGLDTESTVSQAHLPVLQHSET
jgi:hypothetical protein